MDVSLIGTSNGSINLKSHLVGTANVTLRKMRDLVGDTHVVPIRTMRIRSLVVPIVTAIARMI